MNRHRLNLGKIHVRSQDDARSILIRFPHGLGDAVQLTSLLKHFNKARPGWAIDIVCGTGKHTIFRGLARRAYSTDEPGPSEDGYQMVTELGWYENYNAYGDCPSTKVTNCLRDVFQIEPDHGQLTYTIHVSDEAKERARAALIRFGIAECDGTQPGRFKLVLAHHKGNTSQEKKNLSDADLLATAHLCYAHGYTLGVLDWDGRTGDILSHHPAVKILSHVADPVLWLGHGTGDGETIAALGGMASACVGIDSGPGHVFGACPTPAVIVWVRHHPIQFYDLAVNVVHLLPENHRSISPAHHEHCFAFFRDNYNHRIYRDVGKSIADEVAGAIRVEPLKANPMTRSHMLKAKNFHVEYYDEHRRAGLDYLGHGDWQERYGRWLVEALAMSGKDVLDVGCACGSICYGIQKAGARAHGVDLNNHMIALGREKFPVPLYVCDTINLHLFGDGSFELVHSNQVGEHWRKELLYFILKEQLRVLKPGGLNFCVMDTLDLFERQQREGEKEDPTNACIETLAWWREQFLAAGYVEADPRIRAALVNHSDSYFKSYDWDWCLYQKPHTEESAKAAEAAFAIGSPDVKFR
jgi:SAM-dependent methyltransferase/ADP-heptose:LPS heptosyltransferase